MAKCSLGRLGAVHFLRYLMKAIVVACVGLTLPVAAQTPSSSASSAAGVAASAAASAPRRLTLRWQAAPRISGRLTAADLGLVINTADPYSVEVGEYYARRRGLSAAQVLRLALPLQAHLGKADAQVLRDRIDAHFGPKVQALALAWVKPYAVECQSITGVLALGFDANLCAGSCGRSTKSGYFNSASGRPLTDHALRPSMLLAAGSPALARQLIDRGIASDHSLGLRGATPVHAYFMATSDEARSVRVLTFPPPGLLRQKGVEVHVDAGILPNAPRAAAEGAASLASPASQDASIVLLQTGAPLLPSLTRLHWAPGALADHLTSFGGLLDQVGAQTPALAWIDAGATASYGTVSEPCNHPQKFPHPQVLLLHYLQGATAIEAYWKSVAWPLQGVFIGEPLAAPFARVVAPP